VSINIPVAWGEMDALGHVNNAAYFRYLESARVEYLRRLGYAATRAGGAGGGLAGAGPGGVGFILQSVQCRFRRPVTFPDTLRVTARCTDIGQDRFTLTHEILSAALNDVAAIGIGTIVCYDYAAGAKMPMPTALREAIERVEHIA
jgi:acyl-CoA thioester hydrolase